MKSYIIYLKGKKLLIDLDAKRTFIDLPTFIKGYGVPYTGTETPKLTNYCLFYGTKSLTRNQLVIIDKKVYVIEDIKDNYFTVVPLIMELNSSYGVGDLVKVGNKAPYQLTNYYIKRVFL